MIPIEYMLKLKSGFNHITLPNECEVYGFQKCNDRDPGKQSRFKITVNDLI